MKALTGFRAAIFSGAFATVAVTSSADAGVILTYTGLDFTAVTGTYTTSDKITATIDLSSPLGYSAERSTPGPNSTT
jgi:hypothetical protein